jgi:hypothetical protein
MPPPTWTLAVQTTSVVRCLCCQEVDAGLRRGGRSAFALCFERAVRRGRNGDMDNALNHDEGFGSESEHRGVGRRRVGGRIRQPALGGRVLIVNVMNGVTSGVDDKRDQEDRQRRGRKPSPVSEDSVTA